MMSRSVQVRSRFSPDTNQFGQIRADSRGMKAQSMLLMLQGRVGGRAVEGGHKPALTEGRAHSPRVIYPRLGAPASAERAPAWPKSHAISRQAAR